MAGYLSAIAYKPKKGWDVYRTERGAEAVQSAEVNAGDLFGEVLSFEGANICIVRCPSGDVDRFIWRFRNGALNEHFTWDGKPA